MPANKITLTDLVLTFIAENDGMCSVGLMVLYVTKARAEAASYKRAMLKVRREVERLIAAERVVAVNDDRTSTAFCCDLPRLPTLRECQAAHDRGGSAYSLRLSDSERIARKSAAADAAAIASVKRAA